MSNDKDVDLEVDAISALIAALKPLDSSARLRVLEFVIKRFDVPGMKTPSLESGPAASAEADNDSTPSAPQGAAHALPQPVDIRTFGAEKSPRTVNEKVALVAYYLAHLASASEKRDFIVSDDIKTYFIQAGFPLPSAPANMTLAHAKNAGYLDLLERGQYRLNAVGYNLVAHKLPSGDAPKTRRKATRKSAGQARKTTAKRTAKKKAAAKRGK